MADKKQRGLLASPRLFSGRKDPAGRGRVGIISDIHSNYDALTAVLSVFDSEGIRRLYCCGDIIGYGAQPNECVSELIKRRAVCVAGNHEYGAMGLLPMEWFNSLAAAALDWTRTKLNKESLDFIHSLPLTGHEPGFMLVHGTPYMPEEFGYILTLVEGISALNSFTDHVCFFGHSHIPTALYLRLSSGIFGDITGDRFTVDDGIRYVINPGGVGQPRDRDPRASAAIYDTGTGLFTRFRVGYDIKSAQEKIISAGLPKELAQRLELGI